MTFTPTFLNELSYSYSYGAVISNNGSNALTYAGSPDIAAVLMGAGCPPYVNSLNRIPNVSFSNLTGFAGFGNYNDYNRNHSIWDNLTKVWGKHTVKFGAEFHWYQKHENAGGPNTGDFSFSGDDIPTEWANFLNGVADNYSQASDDFDAKIRQHVFEAYAQDEWRVRPNLTLNYGVRFSRFGSPYDENGHTTNFDPSAFNPANAPVVLQTETCIMTDANGNPLRLRPGQSPNPNYNPLNGIRVDSGGSKQVTDNPVYFVTLLVSASHGIPRKGQKLQSGTWSRRVHRLEAPSTSSKQSFHQIPPFITFNSFQQSCLRQPRGQHRRGE